VPASDYDVVVFENRFPSFSTRTAPDTGPGLVDGEPLYPRAPAFGRCEVVCFTSRHDGTFADLTPERARTVIEAWADRTRELSALPGVEEVFCFENRGKEIGVTLAHPHGQIYAYPFVPPRPKKELEAASEYRSQNEDRCLHCDLLAGEHEDGRRVVAKGDHFTAFVPFYAHFPYEAHVYARRCAPSIADLSGEERWDLARTLKRLLVGYDRLFGFSLPYMMVMHQAPTDGRDYEGVAHFHVEFYPPNRTADKLKYLAGSETGAGAYIVDALPEETAKTLRAAVEGASS
jgi:UDPglucose--hexose-1-phosphate uridylyltransferase